MNPMGLLFVAIGLFALCGAGFDWDWFMNARKAQWIVRLFGRNGARVFYAILGAGLVILGVLFTVGVIQDTH